VTRSTGKAHSPPPDAIAGYVIELASGSVVPPFEAFIAVLAGGLADSDAAGEPAAAIQTASRRGTRGLHNHALFGSLVASQLCGTLRMVPSSAIGILRFAMFSRRVAITPCPGGCVGLLSKYRSRT
jgi:hypothetical protein